MGLRKINITLDNVNPMISYAPLNWWTAGQIQDPAYLSYDNHGTFTLTQQQGANASLTFHGTAIWLFGAKRANHGTYTASIDNQTPTNGDGHSSPDVFRQVLFNAECSNGAHTVVLTNTGNVVGSNFLDIDYITYETQIDDSLVAVTQQDTDPAFSYSDSWFTELDNLGYYSGGTGHATDTAGAYVTYTFQVSALLFIVNELIILSIQGPAVQIFGTAGPGNGGYTVQIDGGQSESYNATAESFSPQTMIYENNNLGQGSHIVKLINQPYKNGQTLNIDYAIVSQAPSSNQPVSSSRSSLLTGGVIGGIIAGACIIVAVAMVLSFLVWRKGRNRKPRAYDLSSPVSTSMDLPDQSQMYMHPVPFYTTPQPSTVHNHDASESTQAWVPQNSTDHLFNSSPSTSDAPYTHAQTDHTTELASKQLLDVAQLIDRKDRGTLVNDASMSNDLPPAYNFGR